MKKSVVLLTVLMTIGVVVFVNCTKTKNLENEKIDQLNETSPTPSTLGGTSSQFAPTEKLPTVSVNDEVRTDGKVVTHYDTESLDEEVIDDAHRLDQDPATHRMLVRKEADGTKIYRSLGMHIIVNPDNETVYLPDEL